jgi:hypothetical protein
MHHDRRAVKGELATYGPGTAADSHLVGYNRTLAVLAVSTGGEILFRSLDQATRSVRERISVYVEDRIAVALREGPLRGR